jgi:SAM-dependent methyltransferase
LWAPYEAMGEHFARHAEDSGANAHYDRPAVLRALGNVAGRRVLDAACGPGLYAEVLVRAGADVHGFDASERMVELARQRLGDRIDVRVGRLGDKLPYADDDFHLAVCALAIHYADDRSAAFAELHRVLRPGGALVVSTQHPTADWLRKGGSYFDRVLETDVWNLPDGPFPMRFWREPLVNLCRSATDAGFVIDLLDEPRPTPAMREREPEDYARLLREPGFLVLRLRKLDRS